MPPSCMSTWPLNGSFAQESWACPTSKGSQRERPHVFLPATLRAPVDPVHPASPGTDAAPAGSTQQLHKSFWILDARSPKDLSSLLETEKENFPGPSKYSCRVSFRQMGRERKDSLCPFIGENKKRLNDGFAPGVASILSLARKHEFARALP